MRTPLLLLADMVPPLDERILTSPAALSVAIVALIATCIISVALIRRRNLKREPHP